jgi:S1-C subfamily serine protease
MLVGMDQFWPDDPRRTADHSLPSSLRTDRRDRRVQRRRRRVAIGALAAVVAMGGVTVATSRDDRGSPAAQAGTQTRAQTGERVLSTDEIAELTEPAIVDIETELASGAAAGTGMVITASGEVLTNNHVIEGATDISVTIGDSSRSYDAEVIGTAPEADVALLQVDGVSDLPTVTLGDSSALEVGDAVVAIGNALDLPGPPRVTEGAITALAQSITVSGEDGSSDHLTDLIQTSAELQPGNSGGPLFDDTGRVIGVNTAAELTGRGSRSTSESSTGFAIPIDAVEGIVAQIQDGDEGGGVRVGPAGYLGVAIRNDSAGVSGALVSDVEPDSPADAAGLEAGDVVVSIDGASVDDASELGEAIRAHDPGDDVELEWIDADGQRRTATVTLAESPLA